MSGRPEPEPSTPVREMTADEMISLVGHEVRNHLAVIQGFGNELGKSWERLSEDTKRDSVRRMTERARYLNAVVANLLYMRRIEAATPWQSPGAMNLSEFLSAQREELNLLTGGKQVETSLGRDGLVAHGDPQRLRQILTNLVLNASRFAPSDSSIMLSAQARGSDICVEVRDQGPGVPVENRDAIFEKFTRLESGGAGIGLGLFISRELARSMGGDLWVEDPDEGQGACFVCSLPRAETD